MKAETQRIAMAGGDARERKRHVLLKVVLLKSKCNATMKQEHTCNLIYMRLNTGHWTQYDLPQQHRSR